MMIPPGVEHLAAQAVELVKSHWILAASPVADSALKEAGKSIFTFLKDRLTRPAAAGALEELEQAPQEQANATAVKLQIEKEAAANPDFEKALRNLIESFPPTVMQQISQKVTQTGDNNKSAQVSGNNNQTRIG